MGCLDCAAPRSSAARGQSAEGVVGSDPAGRGGYIKRLGAKVSNRFLFAWGLNLPASFPCNHRRAAVRPTALVRDPVQTAHQLGNVRHRVVRRHSQANMPEDIGDRLVSNFSLA